MACKAETPPNDCILNLCLFYSVEEIVFNNLPDQWSMFLNPLNTNVYNAVPIIKSYHATQYILSIYTRCLSYIKQGQVTWLPVAAQAGLLSSCPSPLGLEYHPQNNIAYQIKRALWKKNDILVNVMASQIAGKLDQLFNSLSRLASSKHLIFCYSLRPSDAYMRR